MTASFTSVKILYEKEKCIGCGTCSAICPKFFEMGKDDKTNLKDSKINSETNNYELEVDNPECIEEAAESCPVQIIYVIKK